MTISKKMASYQLNGSMIRQLFEEGKRLTDDGSGQPVYDFSIGNPEIEPSPLVKNTLQLLGANEDFGHHRYMSNQGYLETRQAVGASLVRQTGLPFKASDVVMTVGAAGAVNVALKVLVDFGDEVIVCAPYFLEYNFYIENHGGKRVVVPTTRDFDLDVDAIAAAITDKTAAVLINNPNNPTGVVYPQTTLDRLGEMLRTVSKGRSRPVFLIDDAPYRKLVYSDGPCTSALNAYEHCFMATSFSKDLGLPGERIGFLAVSPHMVDSAAVVSAATLANRILGFVNAPALWQRVVTTCVDDSVNMTWYRTNRDLFWSALVKMGYELPDPDGGFYLFPKAPGGDDLAFAAALKKRRILVVPGAAFEGPGHFRLAYCVNKEKIAASLPLFEQTIADWK